MKDKKMFVLFTITLLVMALFTSMIRMDIKEVKKEITSIPAQETTEREDMGKCGNPVNAFTQIGRAHV